MRRALPLAVVALVCLAGCGGVLGGDTSSPATSTPAAVPTDSPLEDPPDGLTEDGVADPAALATAHADALENRSITVRTTERLRATNGTELATSNRTERVSANHSHSVATTSLTGITTTSKGYARYFGQPVTRFDEWYDSERRDVQVEAANETTYLSQPIPPSRERRPRANFQSHYVGATSDTVSSENGSIEVRLDGLASRWSVAGIPVNVTDATVTVTMTDTGRVEQYHAEFTGDLPNTPGTAVEGERTIRYTDVGETSVTEPDWLSMARNRTTVDAQ